MRSVFWFKYPKYVISKLETIQRRELKWNCVKSVPNKEHLKVLRILPLPMYVQLKNLLLLSKLILGRYEACNLDKPYFTEFSRANLFQLRRPRKATCEQNFMYQTCRLANVLKINLREGIGLKQRLLKIFCSKFEQYNESDKCTWKLACDCTMNNCRKRTVI